jgi:hypothetical protein
MTQLSCCRLGISVDNSRALYTTLCDTPPYDLGCSLLLPLGLYTQVYDQPFVDQCCPCSLLLLQLLSPLQFESLQMLIRDSGLTFPDTAFIYNLDDLTLCHGPHTCAAPVFSAFAHQDDTDLIMPVRCIYVFSAGIPVCSLYVYLCLHLHLQLLCVHSIYL